MKATAKTKTTTVVEGMTFEFTQEEVQHLFDVCGNIGGGAITNGVGNTPVRKVTDKIYEAIRKASPEMECTNPFVGCANFKNAERAK